LQVDTVLVVDFGAQYAQLIARRVRECHVYSEIVPCTMPVAEMLAKRPKAIILSGGPASVYAPGAPPLPAGLFDTNVPVLGICYGFQLMVQQLGGTVAKTGAAEYGSTRFHVLRPGRLLAGTQDYLRVWMSHGDSAIRPPDGFTIIGQSQEALVGAIEDVARARYGVQFHPEVMHTEHGTHILQNFLNAAGCRPSWTTLNIVEDLLTDIREQIGTDGRAICGLSGGVDSAVAAALVQRAIGDRLTCVFVDHGLLRKGEAEQVEQDFVAATGVKLTVADESSAFLVALDDVVDPEAKRKIIGREFIRAFERAVSAAGGADFLVQGTLYPDVVESGGGTGTANIKSHHNVGGLPDDLKFRLVEPLRWLFKDEVRRVGAELGLPPAIVGRQPFPGPGLAIRIVGAVTAGRLRILREADAIVRAELTAAGLDGEVWQCPVVLLADVRSVGVQGDGRTYGHPVVLRPVTSEDAMTADWARLPDDLVARISTRVTNEVPEVNRVVLDVTSKPPGTIEWELFLSERAVVRPSPSATCPTPRPPAAPRLPPRRASLRRSAPPPAPRLPAPRLSLRRSGPPPARLPAFRGRSALGGRMAAAGGRFSSARRVISTIPPTGKRRLPAGGGVDHSAGESVPDPAMQRAGPRPTCPTAIAQHECDLDGGIAWFVPDFGRAESQRLLSGHRGSPIPCPVLPYVLAFVPDAAVDLDDHSVIDISAIVASPAPIWGPERHLPSGFRKPMPTLDVARVAELQHRVVPGH
jgi:GMP synthase (glutamine-hydrolysing)